MPEMPGVFETARQMRPRWNGSSGPGGRAACTPPAQDPGHALEPRTTGEAELRRREAASFRRPALQIPWLPDYSFNFCVRGKAENAPRGISLPTSFRSAIQVAGKSDFHRNMSVDYTGLSRASR